MDNRVHESALAGWLHGQPLGLAATLTFVPRLPGPPGCLPRWLSTRDASECVRVYLRRLDRVAYGARAKHGQRLAAAVVREGGEARGDKHIHYHLALQVPPSFEPEGWARRAAAEWTAMDWASPEQNVFKPMWSREWVSYILKDRDKPIYLDGMDFENWRLV